jgi:hypothetical protein
MWCDIVSMICLQGVCILNLSFILVDLVKKVTQKQWQLLYEKYGM